LHRSFKRAALLSAIGLLAGCAGNSTSLPAAGGNIATQSIAQFPAANVFKSCATVLPGDDARCYAQVRTDVRGIGPNSTPSGFGPSSLQSAYALPSSTNGAGQTVGIVDAYDDPNAESDLGVYRAQYGLPACTTANGCFKKLNQKGQQGSYPTKNGGWAEEISLDLDMASAICPNCKIILVEANSATNANLGTSVNTAVSAGATVVSNSYGGSETGSSNSNYSHSGVIITASAGDNGTGASQPCSYATVVCVGGTTLSTANNARGWTETAWSGSGSGCSAYVAKPSWQTDKGCTRRSESDVSADANPNTGVAVYDSYAYEGYQGWLVFGGTSVSSPVIASVYALAGNASSLNAAQSIWSAGGSSNLNDVTSGSNGSCSKNYPYICKAGVGYDGPTGWGTPNGIGAF
jgi:subtilase family serine protease